MRRFLAFTGALAFFALHWKPLPTRLQTTSAYFPWEPIGPNNLGHNLITGLRLGNTLYVGSAFGGLYRSTDEGHSWEVVPGFNLNANGDATYRCPAVTALATDGTNLYVGTGAIAQYNPSGIALSAVSTTQGGIVGAFGRPGMGVFVSTDGGQTFSNPNATWKLSYPNLSYANDYANTGIINVVDIAISGNKIAILTPDSVFISSDNLTTLQGSSISRPSGTSFRSIAWGASDVLFVTTSTKVYRSTDGGATFAEVPASDFPLPPNLTGVSGIGGGNVVIRSAPSNPAILYVASAKSDGSLVAVWASSDNGNTWTRIANQENASFAVLGTVGTSALALRVDPTDPSHIVIGGNQLWEFTPDFGWQRISPSNQDPFILRLPRPIRDVVFLNGGDLLVIGDGRLVRITQNKTRIEDANKGIQATRILSVAVSPNGDVHISGASPINISSTYPTDPLGSFRLVNGVTTDFNPVSAPLGWVAVSAIDPGIVFFSYQDGRLRMAQNRGQNYISFYAGPIGPTTDSTLIQSSSTSATQDRPEAYGPLYPPFALIEKLPADRLVKGTDNKRRGTAFIFIATSQAIWRISNPISTNPDSIANWNRVSGGTRPLGLNASHTYSSYLNTANAIPTAMAVDSAYTVWVGTSNGRLYRLRNAHDITIDRDAPTTADTLENLTSTISSLIDGRWISAIAVHPNNPNLLAIATGSYTGNTDRIFLTTNATAPNPTFVSIHANLPNIPVYSLFFYPDSASLLFAGTEWGLWRCMDVNNPSWEEMTGEAIGRVPVTAITWKPYIYREDTVDNTNPDNPLTEGRLLPDPEKPIYIATWGRGVWKLNSRSATALTGAPAGQGIAIQAYPNPFSHTLSLKLSLPNGAEQIHWQLYTIDGRRVGGQTYTRSLPPGEHTLTWHTPALSTGLYLLQVEVLDTQRKRYTQTLKLIRE